ncbi:MAG TPA: hypothetical protein VJB11_03445 [archaeon]|nr:hypothetical protein [archaeon]
MKEIPDYFNKAFNVAKEVSQFYQSIDEQTNFLIIFGNKDLMEKHTSFIKPKDDAEVIKTFETYMNESDIKTGNFYDLYPILHMAGELKGAVFLDKKLRPIAYKRHVNIGAGSKPKHRAAEYASKNEMPSIVVSKKGPVKAYLGGEIVMSYDTTEKKPDSRYALKIF